ncbi:unnamed protein product [Durusdinium trenchii]|uniref:Uncharacterized protein n=1 Tax=Durusdinium trenchii TaxID=1381693 RepID=A0ABP0L5B7_9DINO
MQCVACHKICNSSAPATKSAAFFVFFPLPTVAYGVLCKQIPLDKFPSPLVILALSVLGCAFGVWYGQLCSEMGTHCVQCSPPPPLFPQNLACQRRWAVFIHL